jgi:hypothetical protein
VYTLFATCLPSYPFRALRHCLDEALQVFSAKSLGVCEKLWESNSDYIPSERNL